jgi:hypothetical protein
MGGIHKMSTGRRSRVFRLPSTDLIADFFVRDLVSLVLMMVVPWVPFLTYIAVKQSLVAMSSFTALPPAALFSLDAASK